MNKIKENVKPLLNIHYLTNILLASNYYLLKNIPYLCGLLFETCEFEWREVEILMLLVVFVAVKSRKATTGLQFVNTVCTFSKVANIILFWREGPVHVFVFGLAWFLHFVFLPKPVYKGPQNIQYFRGGHLENELKRDDRMTYLICFQASWSPPCNDFTPIFAEISNKFGGLNNFKFGKFDCNMYPDFALKFNISNSSLSKQLPTVILFQKGKEVKRRPFVDSKGTVFNYLMTYDNIVRDFDLNKIYYECKNNQIVIKPVNTTTNQTPLSESEVNVPPQEKKDN